MTYAKSKSIKKLYDSYEDDDFGMNDLYEKPKRKYSDEELTVFDREIQGFYRTKKVCIPQKQGKIECLEIKLFDLDNFLKAQGAMTATGAMVIFDLKKVIPNTRKQDEYYWDCRPILYEILMDKVEQWKLWRGRVEGENERYGVDIQVIAEEMKVKTD